MSGAPAGRATGVEAVARVRRAAAALALLVVAACAEPPPAPLRVGVLQFPAYELFFLAQSRGEYAPRDIRLVGYRSPVEVVRAYDSGLLDAVAVTAEYAVELQLDRPVHRIVLVLDESHGADALLARPEIATLADLRGHRVAAEASALGRYMARRALAAGGLGFGDVELVSADVADQERVYLAGEADAVVTYEPIRSRLLAAGARELFSSREIPGEIIDVLLTREDIVEDRRDALVRLARGWFTAMAELERDPLGAATAMARREQITPQQFLESLRGIRLVPAEENLRLLGGGPSPLRSAIEQRAQDGLVAGARDDAPAFDARPLLSDAIVRGLGP